MIQDVIREVNQTLLRTASGTRAKSDCALVDHDDDFESRMIFSSAYPSQCGWFGRVGRAIPIDDNTGNAAALHVRQLFFDLRRIPGVVADFHMALITEPGLQFR